MQKLRNSNSIQPKELQFVSKMNIILFYYLKLYLSIRERKKRKEKTNFRKKYLMQAETRRVDSLYGTLKQLLTWLILNLLFFNPKDFNSQSDPKESPKFQRHTRSFLTSWGRPVNISTVLFPPSLVLPSSLDSFHSSCVLHTLPAPFTPFLILPPLHSRSTEHSSLFPNRNHICFNALYIPKASRSTFLSLNFPLRCMYLFFIRTIYMFAPHPRCSPLVQP